MIRDCCGKTFSSHQRATSGNESRRSVSPVGAQSRRQRSFSRRRPCRCRGGCAEPPTPILWGLRYARAAVPSRLRRCLLLLVLPLLAVGCGSSGGGDASTATLLKDTFSGGKAVKSGKLDVSLGFQAQGLPTLTGPVAFKLAGPFASQGAGKLPKFDFDLDIAAGG